MIMMIQKAFDKQGALFIPFLMAGYPTVSESLEALMILSEVGADIIELGVPFSDPIADGPINQMAAEVSLSNGVNLLAVFEQIQTFRLKGYRTPIILFSYLNPILAFGYEKFIVYAKESGVDGVLVVDLPPEEGRIFFKLAQMSRLEIVLLASPTTDKSRFDLYEELNPSFIYYISRLGVTGIQEEISNHLESELDQLKLCLPRRKIVVGFGISQVNQAKAVSCLADGVVIGSALIKTLKEKGMESFRQLAQQFSKSIHQKNPFKGEV